MSDKMSEVDWENDEAVVRAAMPEVFFTKNGCVWDSELGLRKAWIDFPHDATKSCHLLGRSWKRARHESSVVQSFERENRPVSEVEAAKKAVLARWPDAYMSYPQYAGDIWVLKEEPGGTWLGEGKTENDAWIDAASKLTPAAVAGDATQCSVCNHALHEGACNAAMDCLCVQYPSLRGVKVADPVGEREGEFEKWWSSEGCSDVLETGERYEKVKNKAHEAWDARAALASKPSASEEDDTEILGVIKERNDYEENLTELANAVGEYFGVPVGEWSNTNDPANVAMEILAGGYKTKFDKPSAEGIPEIVVPEEKNDWSDEHWRMYESGRAGMLRAYDADNVAWDKYDHQILRLQMKIEAAQAIVSAKDAEIARITAERFNPLGDNHHNALMCPHCNSGHRELQAELAALKLSSARIEEETLRKAVQAVGRKRSTNCYSRSHNTSIKLAQDAILALIPKSTVVQDVVLPKLDEEYRRCEKSWLNANRGSLTGWKRLTETEETRLKLHCRERQLLSSLTQLTELTPEIEKLKGRRVHTQEWYASHYAKLHDWARKVLPEPYRNQFFSCVANGTYDGVLDVGEPYMCKAGFMVTPSGYIPMDDAKGQIIREQTARAEDAESQLAELRTASEWVSVEDRLPDVLEPCEAQTEDGDSYMAHRELEEIPEAVTREAESFWWSRNRDQEIAHVVRWRPLPPPPTLTSKRSKRRMTMNATLSRAFVKSLIPQARYLNLGGHHCIDDHANDRYLSYRAPSRGKAWSIAAQFLMNKYPSASAVEEMKS